MLVRTAGNIITIFVSIIELNVKNGSLYHRPVPTTLASDRSFVAYLITSLQTTFDRMDL